MCRCGNVFQFNESWHENGCGHFGSRFTLFCRGILFGFPPLAWAPPCFFSGSLVRSIVEVQATSLFLVLHNATHLLILQFTFHCHQSSFSNFYATMNLSYPILRMAWTHLETKLHRRADLVPYYRSGLKLFLCSWGLNQHDALKSITRRDVGSKVN